GAEADLDPLRAVAPRRRIGRLGDPRLEPRPDHIGDERRGARAPVLPGEIAVPAAPARIVVARFLRLARQAQIADRDDAAVGAGAVAVGEGVELLDIAEGVSGLALDPGAQAHLQGAVRRLERA